MRFIAISIALTTAFVAARPQAPANLGKSPVAYGPKPSGCSEFEILVARGTSEPGPFGLIVGDALVRSVRSQVTGSRGYAVQYPADAEAKSVPTGVEDVVNRLTKQSTACPNQKFALVGYSQGAMVMHSAAPKIPESVLPKILALVMFGDPALRRGAATFPGGLGSRLLEQCAPADPVCSPGSDFNPHLTYGQAKYQTPSVAFIVAAFKGRPLPQAKGKSTRK